MANEKISQLPAASTSSSTDLYTLVQGGVNKKITFTAFSAALGGSISAITSLTGDVTGTGPGATATTVAFVGGQSAANVASAVAGYFAATSTNTPDTLVERDGSGNFSAGTITATIVGNVTGNVIGNLTGNVTGNVSGNAGGTAANVTASSNSTLVTLSALTTANSLSSVGTITSGIWRGTAVAIGFGGTGATSAATAFANLSPMTTAGDIIYENSTPAPARLPIGGSGQVLTVVGGLPAWTNAGSGSVSSVALFDGSTSPIYAISGSPVTSSGTLTFTLSTQSANTVFAGPTTGSAAQPSFRSLVSADIPNNAANTTGTASNITASSNSTLTTLSSLSLPGTQVTGNISGNAANVTGTVAIANGGTGQTTKQSAFDALSPLGTAGDTLYYNGTHNVALGIGSTGQVLTVVGGEPAWANTAVSGTVTSVALADGSSTPIYAITGSPVTSSGTLTFTLDTQSANKIFAGPTTGSAAQPTFRLLVSSDIPNNAANTTGTASNITASSNSTLTTLSALSLPGSQVTGNISGNAANVTGTVAIANGGTGQTTANAGFDALSPMTTLGDIIYENSTPTAARLAGNTTTTREFLTSQGSGGLATAPAWTALVSGDIPNNAANTSGTAANITATSNSTLTTLSALSLPTSQLSGSIVLTTQVSGVLPIANGGTNNSSAYTAGSVIFSNGTSLTQNNADFYWDNTNLALGIGVIPATNAVIDVVNNSGSSKAIQLTGYGANVGVRGRYANGTLASPTAATTGNILNFISARGYGASQFAAASTAAINFVASATFTNASNPTYIQFEVTPVGSVTLAEAMRIAPTGNVLIGTTTDSGTQVLQVNGNSNVGTVTAGTWNGIVTAGFSFLTTGTTYTTPSNITTATLFIFTIVGGGGGGGAASTLVHCSGGGAGGAIKLYVTGLSPSTGYAITIGSAGVAGISNTTAATAGGSTTLTIGATTYTAGGGGAGQNTTNASGGTGGTATGGTINIVGQQGGGESGATTASSGLGGTPGFGMGVGGASTVHVGDNGFSGTGYGAGGGGCNVAAGTAGSGAPGCILVEWHN